MHSKLTKAIFVALLLHLPESAYADLNCGTDETFVKRDVSVSGNYLTIPRTAVFRGTIASQRNAFSALLNDAKTNCRNYRSANYSELECDRFMVQNTVKNRKLYSAKCKADYCCAPK